MDYYEDERQRRRPTRDVVRRDDYDDDSYYNTGRGQNRTTTLVKRRDSYEDVDEEITREFSPPSGHRGGYIRETTTIRKSGVRPTRSKSIDEDRYADDRYDDGAYAARRGDRYRDDKRDRSRRRRHSSDYSNRSRSRSPPDKERRKSKIEETLESVGLGGLVGAILGKDNKDSRDRDSPRDRRRSVSRSERGGSPKRGPTREQVTQAITAAVIAGAGEAFLGRKESGGMSGEKGKRIATAAFSAGGVDTLINYGKDPKSHQLRDTLAAAVAGIATSRIVNGSRDPSPQRRNSRSPGRGRNSSRGGVKDLLAAGSLGAAAKKIYDNGRSKSRGRSESRSRYSDTSRSPSRSKSRRRSISRGLAAVGLTGVANKIDPNRERDSRGQGDPRGSRRRYSDDYGDRSDSYDSYRDVGPPRDINDRARSASQSRGVTPSGYSLEYCARKTGDPDTDSSSDLGSSSGEEKERKKGKRKLLLTSGLASIATIHAGHSVYQSYEKRHARKTAVREGKISPEQARQRQNKDRLNEAASIGVAAIGLKGAYSEWKETMEHKKEWNEELAKLKRHHEKRENRRRKFEKMQRQGYVDSGYSTSLPDLHSAPPMVSPPGGWHQPFDNHQYGQDYYPGPPPYGRSRAQAPPHYYDDNPYAGLDHHTTDLVANTPLPHPPVGPDHRPYPRAPRERSPSLDRRGR